MIENGLLCGFLSLLLIYRKCSFIFMNEEELVDRLCIIAANVGLIIDSMSTEYMREFGEELNQIWNDLHDIIGDTID